MKKTKYDIDREEKIAVYMDNLHLTPIEMAELLGFVNKNPSTFRIRNNLPKLRKITYEDRLLDGYIEGELDECWEWRDFGEVYIR